MQVFAGVKHRRRKTVMRTVDSDVVVLAVSVVCRFGCRTVVVVLGLGANSNCYTRLVCSSAKHSTSSVL